MEFNNVTQFQLPHHIQHIPCQLPRTSSEFCTRQHEYPTYFFKIIIKTINIFLWVQFRAYTNVKANFTFIWRYIVTNLFLIKPTRRTNFPKCIFFQETLTCFGQFLCPSSGVFPLYIRHWYMSCCFDQTCMTYTSAQFTMENSWWWAEELPETCKSFLYCCTVHLVDSLNIT